MTANGWVVKTHPVDAKSYSRELALYPDDLLAFVKETQPEEWAKFKRWHNGASDAMFLKRVAAQLDNHGTLHVLRSGFKDVDAKFSLCQFRPSTRKNPALLERYAKNRLTVIRQLHYSRNHENSFDLVLFVNGIPVATAELKTDFTQSIKDAIRQYKQDRLPRDAKTRELEPLLQFKTRALVHFAVSTELVFSTTRLAGEATVFLPFNIGKRDGQDAASAGAGNPEPPKGKGYPTYYLWDFIWKPEFWLDTLGSFIHLERKEVDDGPKRVTKESMIFPRYHQLVAVSELVTAAAVEGPGQTYLVQHSAGSGKSNSIAWTAHRLANVHDAADKKVFDSVIIVTDRRVLDKQLRETVSQFEHKAGVVQVITENSAQLAKTLNDGAPIIVTTLQKFGHIQDSVNALSHRRFAIIVDEAHSSQTGSAARSLREALTKNGKQQKVTELDGQDVAIDVDDEVDPEDVSTEDIINSVVAARGRPANVSYFAFTATPKNKTMELFGRKDADGKPVPFHVYTMRQAIEEGFILDVLKQYTSYETFYQLSALYNEKLVPQKKAKKALGQFMKLHEYNISQRVVIMVEHFREHVASKIGGKAKAMVVTSSRKAAVRYKLAMDNYIKDKNYKHLRTLVAFSGTVSNPPNEYTEAGMNAGTEGEPSDAFKGDDFRLLIVANKYQVGFDQPLLHTMYVDKRLSGVLAVQTLSRLNRMYPGKSDTFVLDFANKPDDILHSFQPYFRSAQLEDVTDPNLVHELMTKLNQTNVYTWTEVENLAEAYFNPKVKSQGALHAQVKPAYDRWMAMEEEPKGLFKKDLGTFLKLYEFLSQIVPYNDSELEKLFRFGKYLLPRLISDNESDLLTLDSDVQLTHYRAQALATQSLNLESGEVEKLAPIGGAGSGAVQGDVDKALKEIVAVMNDLFAGQTSEADFIGTVTAWNAHLMADEQLADQARGNNAEQFNMGSFKDVLTDVVLDTQGASNSIANQMLRDPKTFSVIQGLLAKMVWQQHQNRSSGAGF